MIYPDEVKNCISFLDTYIENDSLREFRIAHLYPKEIAYPDGYYDSRFFDLVIFNPTTKEKRIIKNKDSLDIFSTKAKVEMVRIFADGSTLVRFNKPVTFDLYQAVSVQDF